MVNFKGLSKECQEAKLMTRKKVVKKWRPPESNWGHTDFQSVALPTELGRHYNIFVGGNIAGFDHAVKYKCKPSDHLG